MKQQSEIVVPRNRYRTQQQKLSFYSGIILNLSWEESCKELVCFNLEKQWDQTGIFKKHREEGKGLSPEKGRSRSNRFRLPEGRSWLTRQKNFLWQVQFDLTKIPGRIRLPLAGDCQIEAWGCSTSDFLHQSRELTQYY